MLILQFIWQEPDDPLGTSLDAHGIGEVQDKMGTSFTVSSDCPLGISMEEGSHSTTMSTYDFGPSSLVVDNEIRMTPAMTSTPKQQKQVNPSSESIPLHGATAISPVCVDTEVIENITDFSETTKNKPGK